MLTKYLSVFLISMVPLIELRGAIPVGVAMGLPLWQVYVIAIIGNMLPVPFIFFFARKVLEWGADKPIIGKFFTFCLEKGHKGGAKLKATAARSSVISGDASCERRARIARRLSASAFRCPARVRGPARWPPAFWTWTLSPASAPAWAACCWQAASWAR